MRVERKPGPKRPTVFRKGLLRDQTVIVSGGGSGIGRGIALLLAEIRGGCGDLWKTADPLELYGSPP